MKFFKLIFLLSACFIFPTCKDLSFTDEDISQIRTEKENTSEASITAVKSQSKEQISEEETTFISEDLEISEDTIIQNKKVVLDMVTIKTIQYDLKIIANEFLSNHSVIQNFTEGQTAKEKENGKGGGNILIEAKRASGNLKLILNGENGGLVPEKRSISKEEYLKLKGKAGGNGRDAIYRKFCETRTFFILSNRYCWDECILSPTKGENGGKGYQGFLGFNGKSGGNSGSFHLKANSLSDFHLTDVKKTPGLGSKGGRGSFGGFGGERGKNGRDDKKLCNAKFPQLEKGKSGKEGMRGKDGTSGIEGEVCLENLKHQQAQANTKTESLETNNNQAKTEKTEIKCNEAGSGIMCREVIVENKADEISKKEGVICY